MKPTLILILLLGFTQMVKAQVSKTVELTAGSLKTILSTEELNTVTNLTITGTMDARDFKTMRDEMLKLAVVDMSQATIKSYKGPDGPSVYTSDYGADAIPQDAFYVDFAGKYSLRMVSIPLSTKVIGQRAFQKCEQMRTFQLPSNVTSIKEYAFGWCSGLTSIVIPESVTSIGEAAFYCCFFLTSVTLPSSIDSIQSATFCGCTRLKQIEIPSSVTYLGDESFMDCSQLESLSLPPALTTIGNSAFFRCYGLRGTLTFPSTLTTIGSKAFEACFGLTSLIFPSSVSFIGHEAFASCNNLKSIEMQDLFPSMYTSYNVFAENIKSTAILYVPFGAKKRYAQLEVWHTFANIVEADKGFLVNSPNVRFNLNGGSNQSIELTADFPWTATADQSWITVSPASGDSSQILTITAEAHTGTDKPRNGTITLRSDGVPSLSILVRQLATPTVIHLTPGDLSATFTSEEKRKITNLTITGSMDARDFKTIHDEMRKLEELDISKVTIEAFADSTDRYTGDNYEEIVRYPANTIPTAHSWNADDLTKFALAGHPNLTTVKLPVSLTSIGSWAFKYCSRLTTIELPPSLNDIGMYAFFECRSLSSINIPPSITQLGDGTFSGCAAMKSVYCYPVNPPEMCKDYFFYGVFSLDDTISYTLYVPYGTKERYKKVREWGLFKNTVEMPGFSLSVNNITFEAEPDSASVIEVLSGMPWTANSDQPWLSVTPTFGNGRTTISFTAASNSANIGRIATVTVTADTISQSVTVFQKGLSTAITLDAGTLSTQFTEDELKRITQLTVSGAIDARDFKTMRDMMPRLSVLDLTKATIRAYSGIGGTVYHFDYKANEIPPNAFYSFETLKAKVNLTSIRLPETATAINENAFYYCTGLTNVETTSDIKNIGNSAFYYCTSLTALNTSSSATNIEAYAFQGCTSLTNMGLTSVNDIGDGAFFGCTALKTINMSLTATMIGYGAFRDCSSLTSIRIPSSMTIIEQYAFSGCISLNDVHIEPGVFSIREGAFSGCTALGIVELPNSISAIESNLFTHSGLTSIVIPSSVTKIEAWSFYECQELKSVTLPSSVSFIDLHAFYNCTGLTSIYLYRQIPLMGLEEYQPLLNVNKTTCTLYVPYGSKELYAHADVWKEFMNIVEMPGIKLPIDSISVDANQGSQATTELKGNTPWTAVSDQPWLSVSPSTGWGDQVLTFIADANPGDTLRIANVTVSANGMNDQIIVVSQKGMITQLTEFDALRPLLSCYPNPFISEMTIEIINRSLKEINIEIYSISGQKVRTLAKAQKRANINLVWNGSDEHGRKVAPGVYLLKVNKEVTRVVKR